MIDLLGSRSTFTHILRPKWVAECKFAWCCVRFRVLKANCFLRSSHNSNGCNFSINGQHRPGSFSKPIHQHTGLHNQRKHRSLLQSQGCRLRRFQDSLGFSHRLNHWCWNQWSLFGYLLDLRGSKLHCEHDAPKTDHSCLGSQKPVGFGSPNMDRGWTNTSFTIRYSLSVPFWRSLVAVRYWGPMPSVIAKA